MRPKAAEPSASKRKRCQAMRIRYDDGYGTTAWFAKWLVRWRTTSAAARNNQLVGPEKAAEKSSAAIFKKMVDAICRPAV